MTEEEARDRILEAARSAGDYWLDHVPADYTSEQRVTGAIFSFLCYLDGVGGNDDLECRLVVLESNDEGDLTGEVRVNAMLHEHLYVTGGYSHKRWRKLNPDKEAA